MVTDKTGFCRDRGGIKIKIDFLVYTDAFHIAGGDVAGTRKVQQSDFFLQDHLFHQVINGGLHFRI